MNYLEKERYLKVSKPLPQGDSLKNLFSNNNGQALIGVLAIMTISMLLVVSLITNSLINSENSFKIRQSKDIIFQAESMLHNSILRLERDPSYLGETLTLSYGQVIIEVTGDNPKYVLAKSISSGEIILHKLQVRVNIDDNGTILVDDWREVQ